MHRILTSLRMTYITLHLMFCKLLLAPEDVQPSSFRFETAYFFSERVVDR